MIIGPPRFFGSFFGASVMPGSMNVLPFNHPRNRETADSRDFPQDRVGEGCVALMWGPDCVAIWAGSRHQKRQDPCPIWIRRLSF